ncbi:MAG: TPM domain-containing protein [Ignavibacteriaceae bacterium]
MNRTLLLLIIALLFLSKSSISQNIPVISNYVTDNDSILSINEYQHIDSLCKRIFNDKIAQIVVIVYKQRPKVAKKFDNLLLYAAKIGNVNGIGRKDINDGVVILTVIKDRQIAIANGYLIGDIVPDSTTSRIISQVITPKFRKEEYGKGLIDGIEELKEEIIKRRKYFHPDNKEN